MEMDIRIREATPADKDAVLRIHNNVYEGRDYLKDYYDYYMEAPHITSFLAELQGDIVGFVAQCLVDGGETVVDRAGRVRPDLEGQGVYRTLMKHVAALNKSAGIVRRRALTAYDDKSEEFFARHPIITKRKIIHFEFEVTAKKVLGSVESTCSSITDGQASDLRRIQQSDFATYFSCENIANYLFPSKRVIIDWAPFRVLESNAPIARGIDTVFVSDVNTASPFKHAGLLSCSSVFTCANPGFTANMDVYGADASSFQYHLLFHLKRMLEISTGPTLLALYIEAGVWDSVDMVFVRNVFEGLGLNLLAMSSPANQTLYEKDL